MSLRKKDRIDILGVGIDRLTRNEFHAEFGRILDSGKKATIVYANPHCLNLGYSRPWLRKMLNDADIVMCDGYGIVLGAKLLGAPSLERVTYGDEIWRVLEEANGRRLSIFLLGAKEGVAEKAASRVRQRYPQIGIAGTFHGYFDRTEHGAENEMVIRSINAANPDIVFVGFGMPAQEQWVKENRARLEARVVTTFGATIDFVAGDTLRAPRVVTDYGLEWLTRLAIEPRRLWRRYILGNPLFVFRVLRQRLGGRGNAT